MKRRQQILLAAVVFAIMLFSLVACGGGGNPIVGKWTPDGSSADAFGAADMEMFGVAPDDMVLEFTKTGKVNILIQDKPFQEFIKEMLIDFGMDETEADAEIGGMDFDVQYKVEGNKISMISSFDGETETAEGTFKVSGDSLAITIDNETETFKKK